MPQLLVSISLSYLDFRYKQHRIELLRTYVVCLNMLLCVSD